MPAHLAQLAQHAHYELPARRQWNRWHVVAAAVLVVAGIFVTFDAWRDMFRIALKDEESSHALLVPVVVGWLAWMRRGRLKHCRRVGTAFGPALVALGWFLHSYGDTHLIQSFWHGGAIVLAIGCLVSIVGVEVLWRFLPVFLALFFIVPVPGRLRQQIAIPMGLVTAQVTERLFFLLGLGVTRSGNLLSINGVEVAIAEACNGLRMAFALFLVSFAFAFGSPLRGHTRLIILIASPVSAIACNVLRLVPTVWLYGHYPAPWAERFHAIGGWVMAGVAFLILLGIIRLLRWARVPVTRYTLAYD